MNFKHLHHFLQVAKLGGVLRASLRTGAPVAATHQLADPVDRGGAGQLGTPPSANSGRGPAPTEAGQVVLGYVEDIFSTGAVLDAVLRDYPRKGQLPEFSVGAADAVPKTITRRLIACLPAHREAMT